MRCLPRPHIITQRARKPLPSASSASSVPSAIQTPLQPQRCDRCIALFSYPGECLNGIHTVDLKILVHPAYVRCLPRPHIITQRARKPRPYEDTSSFSVFSVFSVFSDSDTSSAPAGRNVYTRIPVYAYTPPTPSFSYPANPGSEKRSGKP